MPKRTIDVRADVPLLNIASYARRGPGRRDKLTHAEVEQIERTVRRVPEVMVKVLSRGGRDLKAVQRHLDYIGRKGQVEIETDEGERLNGRGLEKALLEDWDLDLDSHRRRPDLDAAAGRAPPKLVHKLIFSMPAGTPPDKVLAAVRTFGQEEFALKHRYAMVLHTDEPHPHVHMIVKAMSEQGERLHVRKATLRNWRLQFAHHLRQQGLAANATERAVRGETKTAHKDGIYRASLRGDSRHVQRREDAIAYEIRSGILNDEGPKARMLETRREVVRGWKAVAELIRDRDRDLAHDIMRFYSQFPPPQTDNEQMAERILAMRLKLAPSHAPHLTR